MSLSLTGGPTPAGAGVIWLSLGGALPSPIDLTAAGFTGCRLWAAPTVAAGVAFSGGSTTRLPIPIPNDRALACAQLAAQGAALVASAPGRLTFSGFARILIGL